MQQTIIVFGMRHYSDNAIVRVNNTIMDGQTVKEAGEKSSYNF